MYEWTHIARRCAISARSSLSTSASSGSRFYASKRRIFQDGVLEPDEPQVELKQAAREVASGGTASSTQTSPIGADGATSRGKSSVRRPLPLSPLMDPAYLAAKQKHRLPKAPPSKNPTSFQQQLAKNPYAQALATPVRMCTLTRTVLPSFFLQDFELIAHPTTYEPWYLPRSLTSAHSSPSSALSIPSSSPPSSSPAAPSPSTNARHGPRAYVLSRLALLRATLEPKSGFTNGYTRFPNGRDAQWKPFHALRIRWRRDVDTFVLELMRRRVVEALLYLSGEEKGELKGKEKEAGKEKRNISGAKRKNGAYLIPCPGGWEDVGRKKQIGAILWVGGRGADIDRAEELGIEGGDIGRADRLEEETGPGEFATLDLDKERKSKMPVHNLRLLLGAAHVADLQRQAQKTFGTDLVVLKNRRSTIDVQLRLWKLQGYLAKHESVM